MMEVIYFGVKIGLHASACHLTVILAFQETGKKITSSEQLNQLSWVT